MQELWGNIKIRIAIIAVAVLIVIFIVALVFRPKNQRPPANENPQLELVWWNPDNSPVTAYQEIIQEFQNLPGNRSVRINIVNQNYGDPKTYYRQIITDMAKNQGPDIFAIRNDELPAWKEYLTPIENVFGLPNSQILANYREAFADLVVKSTVDRDKIYTVSNYLDTLALYYNKNLLEQASIPLPPVTWKDLDIQLNSLNRRDTANNFIQSAISLGTGLNQKDGNISRDANILDFQDIIPTLILQSGGQIYDPASGRVSLGAPRNQLDLDVRNISNRDLLSGFTADNPTLSAINFYSDFANPNSQRYSWNNNSKSNVDAFLEGKLAYIIQYSGFQNIIEERNSRLDYGISELPQLNTDLKKTYGRFFMHGINRQLEVATINNPNDTMALIKLQKAREFLYFLSLKNSQEKFISQTGRPSGFKEIINQQLQGAEKPRIFAAGTLYADNYFKPDVERSEKMWGNIFYRIQFENLSPSESLALAITEYSLDSQSGAKIRL